MILALSCHAPCRPRSDRCDRSRCAAAGKRAASRSPSFSFEGVNAVDRVSAERRARYRRQQLAAVGDEALLQPRAVRRGPQAHRRLLRRPRVPGCEGHVVRRRPERGAERSQAQRTRRRRPADRRRRRSASKGSSSFANAASRGWSGRRRSAKARRGISRSSRRRASGRSTNCVTAASRTRACR